MVPPQVEQQPQSVGGPLPTTDGVGQPMTSSSPPPYGPSPAYPPDAPLPSAAPLQKQRRRWPWVVGMSIVVVVVALVACVVAATVLLTARLNPQDNAKPLVNEYYSAIQAQDYTAAYGYIASHPDKPPLTEATFLRMAQAADQQWGPVTTYTITAVSPQDNSARATVQVTRSDGHSYEVHVEVAAVLIDDATTGYYISSIDGV